MVGQPIGVLRMAEVISQPTIIQHTAAHVARAEVALRMSYTLLDLIAAA
jgi:hypothetical protein